MKFKRKKQISSSSHKCSHCGSQRRMFGAGNMKFKALEKARKITGE